MNSSSLNQAQIDRLCRSVGERLHFLTTLLRRMEQLGFPPDDPVYRATTKAFEAMHELRIVTIYLRPGGSKPPEISMGAQIMPEATPPKT